MYLKAENETRQVAVDADLSGKFLQQNPTASAEQKKEVADIIGAIQVPDSVHAVLNLQADISQQDIADYTAKMNQSIEAALAKSQLDAPSQASLRLLLQSIYLRDYVQVLKNASVRVQPSQR